MLADVTADIGCAGVIAAVRGRVTWFMTFIAGLAVKEQTFLCRKYYEGKGRGNNHLDFISAIKSSHNLFKN